MSPGRRYQVAKFLILLLIIWMPVVSYVSYVHGQMTVYDGVMSVAPVETIDDIIEQQELDLPKQANVDFSRGVVSSDVAPATSLIIIDKWVWFGPPVVNPNPDAPRIGARFDDFVWKITLQDWLENRSPQIIFPAGTRSQLNIATVESTDDFRIIVKPTKGR